MKKYIEMFIILLKTEWQTDRSKVSEIMTSMIEEGLKISKEEYLGALNLQSEMAKILDKCLESVDVLICPSAASEAPIGVDTADIEDHFNLDYVPLRLHITTNSQWI